MNRLQLCRVSSLSLKHKKNRPPGISTLLETPLCLMRPLRGWIQMLLNDLAIWRHMRRSGDTPRQQNKASGRSSSIPDTLLDCPISFTPPGKPKIRIHALNSWRALAKWSTPSDDFNRTIHRIHSECQSYPTVSRQTDFKLHHLRPSLCGGDERNYVFFPAI